MKTQLTVKQIMVILLWASLFIFPAQGFSAESKIPEMVLTQAVICESIKNFQPVNPAAIFSISLEEVFCFSNFDPVRAKTHIFHKWFKHDKLIFTMRLSLTPPKWSSLSKIQLRDEDKGPWRVEIRDDGGNILQTLRFSISD